MTDIVRNDAEILSFAAFSSYLLRHKFCGLLPQSQNREWRLIIQAPSHPHLSCMCCWKICLWNIFLRNLLKSSQSLSKRDKCSQAFYEDATLFHVELARRDEIVVIATRDDFSLPFSVKSRILHTEEKIFKHRESVQSEAKFNGVCFHCYREKTIVSFSFG